MTVQYYPNIAKKRTIVLGCRYKFHVCIIEMLWSVSVRPWS